MQRLLCPLLLLAFLVSVCHGKPPKFTLKGEFTKGKLTFSGSGWADLNGNWGVGGGIKIKFRKRSTELSTLHVQKFHLVIEVDKCKFDVYDENDDGVITSEEIHALFSSDKKIADLIMQTLNSVGGDGEITREEFDRYAPLFIEGCERNLNNNNLIN